MTMRHIDVHELLREAGAQKAARAEQFPVEQDCIRMMVQTIQRLKELDWRPACYAPKDGSYFEAIVPGAGKIFECCYLGDWPSGGFFIADAGDLWPETPTLFRLLPSPKE